MEKKTKENMRFNPQFVKSKDSKQIYGILR